MLNTMLQHVNDHQINIFIHWIVFGEISNRYHIKITKSNSVTLAGQNTRNSYLNESRNSSAEACLGQLISLLETQRKT